MSFILDALKKSETDRQRQASPETSYVPAASGDRGPTRWVWVVGVLLAANMLALMYVVLRPDVSPEPAVVTTTEPAPQTTAKTAARTVDEDRQRAPAPVVEQPANSPADPVERQAVAIPTSPPDETTVRTMVPEEALPMPAATAAADAEPAADFMTLSEARVAGMQVDELALELHVFSTVPAERFVFINMRKYREGETLAEGPKIRKIRPDGVLLEYTGSLFLLPRE